MTRPDGYTERLLTDGSLIIQSFERTGRVRMYRCIMCKGIIIRRQKNALYCKPCVEKRKQLYVGKTYPRRKRKK